MAGGHVIPLVLYNGVPCRVQERNRTANSGGYVFQAFSFSGLGQTRQAFLIRTFLLSLWCIKSFPTSSTVRDIRLSFLRFMILLCLSTLLGIDALVLGWGPIGKLATNGSRWALIGNDGRRFWLGRPSACVLAVHGPRGQQVELLLGSRTFSGRYDPAALDTALDANLVTVAHWDDVFLHCLTACW